MDKRDKGYTLYKKGLSCTEISKKLDVSINTVKSWRKRYWTQGADAPAKRTLHPEDAPAAPDPETRPKQGAPPGNVNAVGAGAPKGNRNAVKHGGWSELMFRSWTEEHRQLLDACDEDVDVAIKGLAALAFKAKVSQSDLDDALAAVLEGKADKATTLDGYGITNAYTKDEINAKISSVYKPAGSVAFAELPSLSESILGNVYNVTDAFTTTANFVEGAGNKYPKGTNVVVVKVGDAYKYDVLAGFVDLSGYVEKEAGKGLSDENFTATLKDKLDGIAAGANKYVHPTHTAAASGLYKTTVDEEGHVTATTPVTKDDITNLGIPAQDTTYGKATAAADGLMAAADKSKLDGMSIATDSEVSEMLAEVYGE